MVNLNEKYTLEFIGNNPTVLDTKVNSLGQTCVFYEHPLNGDEDTVFVMIDGVLSDTEFFGTEDFYEGSDYMPELVNGIVMCSFENK